MTGLVGSLVVALVLVAAAYGVHLALVTWRSALRTLPFQSGWVPQAHALSRYHVRWYLATLVFLAFDVEMLFMYPWAVVVAGMGMSSVIEMFVFLGALLVAVVWAWREGALRWA